MEIILFLGGGEEIGVILFIPRAVSKYEVQLLPSKVCAILYPPLINFLKISLNLKKIFGNFFIFGE